MPGPPPLKWCRDTTDDVVMLEIDDKEHSQVTVALDDGLAFVAFTLSHSPCGAGVIEARLGEGSLLQWCVACDDIRIFRSSGV